MQVEVQQELVCGSGAGWGLLRGSGRGKNHLPVTMVKTPRKEQ